MKNYYKVRLGSAGEHSEECYAGNFIGVDFDVAQDLSHELPDEWKKFNRKFVPVFMKAHPNKSKIGAGMACGFLWTFAKGIKKGDVVLCPDGEDHYHVGEITSDYYYQPGGVLPHRRAVQWIGQIDRSAMSDRLRGSAISRGTVCILNDHINEIEGFINVSSLPKLISTDETIEDASSFAMEKHLEDFLVQNWKQTEFGKDYNIFEEDGEIVGQQYQTDTGPIDILAVSKDKKTLLVVELKKGRASDTVVGQIQRYMGYVKEELAEKGQTVRGVIIALEDDLRIRRSLAVASNIEFYRYQVSFKLVKA